LARAYDLLFVRPTAYGSAAGPGATSAVLGSYGPNAQPVSPGRSKRLLGGIQCLTLHDMKTAVLTIRLDPELERRLARVARRTGRSRSEVVRDAVRRQLALAEFADLRRRIMPLAEAQGYLTDEDVFRDVS